MPIFQRSLKTIQQADDGPGPLGAGEDTEAMTWDNGTGKFVMAVGGGGGTSDHALLTHLDYADAGHTGFAGTDVANEFTRKQIFQASLSDMLFDSETLSNSSFATNLAGWTDDGSGWVWSSGAATHTPGATGQLYQDVAAIDGVYLLEFQITGMTAGNVNVYDTVNLGAFAADNGTYQSLANAPDTNEIYIDVSDDFDGRIEYVSLKRSINGFPSTLLTKAPLTGAESGELRSGGTSFYFGLNAGQYADGPNNTALGQETLNLLTTERNNTVLGSQAGGNYTGDGGVFVGFKQGYGEPSSNKLHIGNNDTLSIIEGVMDPSAANQVLIFHAATINMADLPTSSAGLNPGDLWNNSGVLNVA